MDELSWSQITYDVTDSSGSVPANDGLAMPNAAIFTDPVRGQVGTFSGTVTDDGHIRVKGTSQGGNANLDITGNLTITAWIKTNTVLGNQLIVSKASGNAYTLGLWAGSLEMRMNQQAQSYASGFTPATGQWYHVAGVFDSTGAEARFYVDGTPVGTPVAITAPINVNGWWLTIGTYTTIGHGAWDGLLDDVRIYDTALTASEINQVYNGIE